MNIIANLHTDITPDGPDYDIVRRVIELITEDYRDQPSLEAIAIIRIEEGDDIRAPAFAEDMHGKDA
ncbi:hypothetical protein ACC754_39425, partial [Rhizobium johnstonii]